MTLMSLRLLRCAGDHAGPRGGEPVNLTARLLNVLRRQRGFKNSHTVISQPYLPFVPPKWNRVLVLAEAQNVSDAHRAYRETLLRWSASERLTRLGRRAGSLDVRPWDTGWLPLAVFLLGEDPDRTAVSNAVLWSQITDEGANRTPSPALQVASAGCWREMLPLLRLRHLITAGKVALSVMTRAGYRGRWTVLVFPGPMNLSPWLARYDHAFGRDRWLTAYPEVTKAHAEHPAWFAGSLRHKMLFACSVVSEGEREEVGDGHTVQLSRIKGVR